ncbi:MAG: hypothetical protein GWO24_05055 [Akkermansiaceae bacterium]|nr:hypothetical protein [Akkermansiaceae bacterium]
MDYQQEEMRLLMEHRNLAVRGPRGSGKTMPSALLLIWFATTREAAGVEWRSMAAAGSLDQLLTNTGEAVKRWVREVHWDRMGLQPWRLEREITQRHIRLARGFHYYVNSNRPDLVEGAHADHMLMVVDEAKSVEEDMWISFDGYFSSPGDHYRFVVGTPGAPAGRFFDYHSGRLAGWESFHITAEDAVAAGRVKASWPVEMAEALGGEGTAAYRTQVLGEFAGDADGVIPLAWIEAAMQRHDDAVAAGELERCRPEVVSLDVAGDGPDRAVIAERFGDWVYRLTEPVGRPLDQAREAVAAVVKGGTVIVDGVGVGEGAWDVIREAAAGSSGWFEPAKFVAGEATKRRDSTGSFRFTNKRSAAWWGLRELLMPPSEVRLVSDRTLLGDLSAPSWREAAGGRIQVEGKDDVRRRLGRSTDAGDAVVQVFWRDGFRVVLGDEVAAGIGDRSLVQPSWAFNL